MKTTNDLNDVLLSQAKDLAHRRGCTLRSLLDEGLHAVLKEHSTRGSFNLRDASVSGGWMSDDLGGRTMSELIHATYDRPQS